jgi:hypothetical protein
MVFLCSTRKCPSAQKIKTVLTKCLFVGPAYQGKDIMFRFIIEYSSLMDFGQWVIGLFLYEDFRKVIFWLVLKLEIS